MSGPRDMIGVLCRLCQRAAPRPSHPGQCAGSVGKPSRFGCRRQCRAAQGLMAPCARRRLPAQVADGVRAGVPGRRRPGRRPAHARPLQLLMRYLAAAWASELSAGCAGARVEQSSLEGDAAAICPRLARAGAGTPFQGADRGRNKLCGAAGVSKVCLPSGHERSGWSRVMCLACSGCLPFCPLISSCQGSLLQTHDVLRGVRHRSLCTLPALWARPD